MGFIILFARKDDDYFTIMILREYQSRAISMLKEWFANNSEGHPVICMPGGSGKSLVIAAIVKEAVKNWPETKILMLVHSKELIQQNADKLRKLWPGAPLGIYSASIGRRELGEPITYAGIGSVARRASQLGKIDICIIDEVHAVAVKETGMYRKLLSDLFEINPDMRIIGLSASPYRLGHGMIHQGSTAIFTDIIEPVSIEELVKEGYLVPLRSKITDHKLDSTGIHKAKGEFIQSEMEEKYNTYDHNEAIVKEIITLAKDKKHWLVFCAGISHSNDVAECFKKFGINAVSLTSQASKIEREKILYDFENGKIQAICNVGILTTGYDFPALDCIAFLRSTMSPGLYLQMAVRGMRPAENKEHCLVLDFAGVVAMHGPITFIQPPSSKSNESGDAPTKKCIVCNELVHISAKVCPACGAEFPEPEKEPLQLRHDDIMGLEGQVVEVKSWFWRVHESRTSGKKMLACTYYNTDFSEMTICEYLPVLHDGYAGKKSIQQLINIASSSGAVLSDEFQNEDAEEAIQFISDKMNGSTPPKKIEYRMEGKFPKILNRSW